MRRRRELTKQEAQQRHAQRRARERFGAVPTQETLRRLVRDIQEGRALFVKRTSLRCSVWQVEYMGQPARVVYDRQRKQIVTFMEVTRLCAPVPPTGHSSGAEDRRGYEDEVARTGQPVGLSPVRHARAGLHEQLRGAQLHM